MDFAFDSNSRAHWLMSALQGPPTGEWWLLLLLEEEGARPKCV